MIEILKLDKLANGIVVSPGDRFVLLVDGKEVHRANIDSLMCITHWAYIKIMQSGLAYVIGDENLEADLKKMAAVKWTDRDLIAGYFDNLRSRMPGPEGPQKLGL